MFENINFIKSSAKNDGKSKNYAPMFRRVFDIADRFNKATLSICGLGYCYSYINGESVTDDLLTAPISNYTKTLWYCEYDVTGLLKVGKNIFAAVCGNGWYNETIKSAWDYDKAPWRDTPKLIMCLEVDGKIILASDDEFKVTIDTPYIYNQLRSGEYFDSRKYDASWNKLDFDDSTWETALLDTNPPKGVFRKCTCEPIRECKVFPSVSVKQIGDEAYIFDFGQNMSGYVRLDVCQPEGTELCIKYAELMNDDNTRNINKMDTYYPESEIETDRFICNGKRFVWSPKFTYHGFNYVVIEGIKDIDNIKVQGVFVHQDVPQRADFECSDNTLNKLYQCGKISSYSNMFYQLTDCPSREKLGWLNDARASIKQMLTNFETEGLFSKWIVDIADAMREDGSLPGIAPTAGWGYDWGNGPVSDGVMFEIPYQVYVQTGNKDLLIKYAPYFVKYLDYLDTKKDENGYISFGLCDWAAPHEKPPVQADFINACLEYHFLTITCLALKLTTLAFPSGEGVSEADERGSRSDIINKSFKQYSDKQETVKKMVMSDYLRDGRCVCNEQTAVAMLIYYGFYDDLEPLKQQLVELIEKRDNHHKCGMVGLRHLYYALSICGLDSLAFKLITNKTYPSQGYWLENGANTLWELWEPTMSRNHHMYSDFMSWIFESILGIKCQEEYPGFSKLSISPKLIPELTYAKGYINTVSGRLSVAWERREGRIILSIDVPEDMSVDYKESRLHIGNNKISIRC